MRDKIETIEYQKVEPKIKLIKGQRDNFGWEISLPKSLDISNEDWVKELIDINDMLQTEVNNLNKNGGKNGIVT